MEVKLACINFQKLVFLDSKKVHAPLYFGVHNWGDGHFFGFWPFEKSCYRYFFGFFARFLRLLQQWKHHLSSLVSLFTPQFLMTTLIDFKRFLLIDYFIPFRFLIDFYIVDLIFYSFLFDFLFIFYFLYDFYWFSPL